MSRIKLEDTVQSMIVKMAEGNPGGAIAMMEILNQNDNIDPQSGPDGGIGAICF